MTQPFDSDKAIAATERGAQARAALAVLRGAVGELTQDILVSMTQPTRTDQELRFFAGQLAGLRRLETRLETDDKQGRVAAQRELQYG